MSKEKLLIFTGCSFTAGAGWKNDGTRFSRDKSHPDFFPNLVNTQIDQFQGLAQVNYGVGGASCSEIFIQTTQAIAEHGDKIDTIFCEWTAMPRYNFNLGFEDWKTKETLSPNGRIKYDVNLSTGGRVEKKYVDDLLDRLKALHHLHSEILLLVNYSNILLKLAERFGIKLYFINGLCPWDNNYFVRLSDETPYSEYTPFTKKEILDVENRTPENILKFYKRMHDEYDRAGGIHPELWVNLYDSMLNNIVDTNYDGRHGGTKSNQIWFQQIKTFLENQ